MIPNHLISGDRDAFPPPYDEDAELAGRATLARAADVIPMECVARGYLAGSGWTQYRERGSVCGVRLPLGLLESAKLPEPIFTPTTKAAEGHDLPLTPAEAGDLVGVGLYERLREAEHHAVPADRSAVLRCRRDRGRHQVRVRLRPGNQGAHLDRRGGDARFVAVLAGRRVRSRAAQPSFDKQYVRDWLDASGWDHEPPPPALPDDVVEATAAKYREAYERISGETFDTYLDRMGPAR